MSLLAYDGASAFDLNAAKQHGAIAITGYLVGHPGGFDPINKARVDQIRALGMGFLPNWERGAGYLVSCGTAGGIGAGQEALAALRALGVPDNGTIACPFSWDVNVDPSLYPQCGQVADGVIAGLGGHYLFSAYGQGGLIDYLRSSGRMKVKGWLSGSSSYPGFNASGPNIAMVQSHDAAGNWINTQVPGTDVNTVIDPYALGAWWPAGSPYARSPSPTTGEASMIYIKAPTAGIGALVGGGKYHFTPAEWAAHGAVRAGLPAAIRDAVAPMVSITDAQWNALPEYRDDLAEIGTAISNVGADLTAKLAAAGDPAKLASALLTPLVAALTPVVQGGQPITQAELESALRTVLGSVDNTPGVPA